MTGVPQCPEVPAASAGVVADRREQRLPDFATGLLLAAASRATRAAGLGVIAGAGLALFFEWSALIAFYAVRV